jgi:hypothetical protein
VGDGVKRPGAARYMTVQKSEAEREEVTLIETAARIGYSRLAKSNPIAASISGGFYFMALGLILLITSTQTYKVIMATWGS